MSQRTREQRKDHIGRVTEKGRAWGFLCGCRIVSGRDTSDEGVTRGEIWIGRCPLHDGAAALLKAMVVAERVFRKQSDPRDEVRALSVMRAAIRKMEED